jgi:hypothetical protein
MIDAAPAPAQAHVVAGDDAVPVEVVEHRGDAVVILRFARRRESSTESLLGLAPPATVLRTH